MPDRISLRRLIQQDAYLSDSTKGRQITGDFCARFQVPNGGRVRNFIHTGWSPFVHSGFEALETPPPAVGQAMNDTVSRIWARL